jgi:hypothetical protein
MILSASWGPRFSAVLVGSVLNVNLLAKGLVHLATRPKETLMSLRNVRTHYFHADATAIGGRLERPFIKNIPVQAPTSLPPVGGEAEAHTANFEFEEIISARATRTRVEGNFLTGLPTTRAASVVEDLNVLNFLRADRLVAYISTEHPRKEPDVPKVNFGRTSITNLRVNDSVLKVSLNLDLLGRRDDGDFPTEPPVFNRGLWNKFGQLYDEKRGFLQCSLVERIEVTGAELPGKFVAPNILEIPNFGRVHIAELLVHRDSYQLIMLRLELGCPTQASISVGVNNVNGGGGKGGP